MCLHFLRPALLVAALAIPTVAVAQAPPEPKAQPAPSKDLHEPPGDAKACADERATVGKGGTLDATPGDKTLTDKLAQSNGVICPPSYVDPEIKAPTPDAGRMRVIPPPGTPGGDQKVEPK